MQYSVEEIPAASWRPGLPQALACYRIVHEVAGTILETPDATETDERNAHEIVAMLNSAAQLRKALEKAHQWFAFMEETSDGNENPDDDRLEAAAYRGMKEQCAKALASTT